MGAGLAELIAAAGADVTFVTPLQVVAPYLDRTFEGYAVRKRLHQLRVDVRTDTTLTRIERDSCTLASYDAETEAASELVVLVTARRSNDRLYRELRTDRGDLEAVYAVGDCVAPRQVADCIFDGHRLAREIDSPDPTVPLPYLRERTVVAQHAR